MTRTKESEYLSLCCFNFDQHLQCGSTKHATVTPRDHRVCPVSYKQSKIFSVYHEVFFPNVGKLCKLRGGRLKKKMISEGTDKCLTAEGFEYTAVLVVI